MAIIGVQRRWGAGLSALLLVAAAGAGQGRTTEPLVRIDDRHIILPTSLGTPVYLYEVTYPADRQWRDGADAVLNLELVVRPESFTVESIDEQAHKLLLRMTPFARDKMRDWGAKVTGPEDSAIRNQCGRMLIEFAIGKTAPPLNDDHPTPDRPCPYAEDIDPERTLLVEGLDAARKRLFVTFAPDPRWKIYETVDDAGRFRLLRRGREASATTYVDFAAPIFDDRLRRLRIWQLDATGKGKAIATVDLTRSARP